MDTNKPNEYVTEIIETLVREFQDNCYLIPKKPDMLCLILQEYSKGRMSEDMYELLKIEVLRRWR